MLAVAPPAGKNPPPTAAEAVAALAATAGNIRDYSLEIEESGPGYSLRFQGQVRDGRLYGRLEQFELEVYAQFGRYHVRGGEVFQGWQAADTAGLKALDAIIRDPLEIMLQITAHDGITVETGPKRQVGGVNCLAYLLEVPLDIPLLPALLTVAEEQAAPERFRAYLWFGSEDGFMYRMVLLFDFSGEKGRAQVIRTYNLGTETIPLPPDLPPPAGVLEV
jgi:hypothetical protein